MIVTHKGIFKDSYNTYEFTVLKQGHIYTLNVTKNEEEVGSYWLEDMKKVRKKIQRYCPNVRLVRVSE